MCPSAFSSAFSAPLHLPASLLLCHCVLTRKCVAQQPLWFTYFGKYLNCTTETTKTCVCVCWDTAEKIQKGHDEYLQRLSTTCYCGPAFSTNSSICTQLQVRSSWTPVVLFYGHQSSLSVPPPNINATDKAAIELHSSSLEDTFYGYRSEKPAWSSYLHWPRCMRNYHRYL